MTELLKIERGVPMPQGRSAYAELIRQMQVGDSFVVDRKRATTLRTNLVRYKPALFKTATIDNDGNVRVWRIA